MEGEKFHEVRDGRGARVRPIDVYVGLKFTHR